MDTSAAAGAASTAAGSAAEDKDAIKMERENDSIKFVQTRYGQGRHNQLFKQRYQFETVATTHASAHNTSRIPLPDSAAAAGASPSGAAAAAAESSCF